MCAINRSKSAPSRWCKPAIRLDARRRIGRIVGWLLLWTGVPWDGLDRAQAQALPRPPNIVIFYADDLGYADVGCFRAEEDGPAGYATPEIDRLARSGRRFTDFLVSSAVCSASRAALLTGALHARLGIHGAYGPEAREGLSAAEVTLGELCQQRGYATACIGKWHLGHHRQFLPLQNGFDEYFGLPYSNDMWPLHPDVVRLPAELQARKRRYPPLPLYDGNEIVDAEVNAEDQQLLAVRYTERAVDFIQRHRDRPFFLYMAPAMVHVPLFASPRFAGRTQRGLFGDALEELDWSLGQIVVALEQAGLREKTLVIFASDNGPWLSYGTHAGSAGPFREGKGTAFEGGVRVPAIFAWPGKIPANTTCPELASTVDIWPTLSQLIDGAMPPHPLDGRDIWPLLQPDKPGLFPRMPAFRCTTAVSCVRSAIDDGNCIFRTSLKRWPANRAGATGNPHRTNSSRFSSSCMI